MNWQIFIAILIAIPVILFPAAYLWYYNAGGIIKAAKARKLAREKEPELNSR